MVVGVRKIFDFCIRVRHKQSIRRPFGQTWTFIHFFFVEQTPHEQQRRNQRRRTTNTSPSLSLAITVFHPQQYCRVRVIMSRAALWKQQGKAQERERHAEELFETVVDEGRQRAQAQPRSIVALWGPDDGRFQFHPLLYQNTIQSPYFQKCCETLHDWNAIIDEIYEKVDHCQPFSHNKTPSTAFCLLLRLLCYRMTSNQVQLTITHGDSPYIRAIGFLFLRYSCPPDQVWQWISPYVQDDDEQESFVVEHKHGAKAISMGQFVRNLFSTRDYYGTTLPRYPLQVERTLQVELLQAEKVAERAQHHYKNSQRMSYFQTIGSRVMALYGDEENPITWYEAIIDRVLTRNEETGATLKYPKFIVTFPEYGNTETVTLGMLDVLDGNWNREGRRGGEPSSSRNDHDDRRSGGKRGYHDGHRQGRYHNDRSRDLYEEVRERERNTVTADRGWARRPPSTKDALSGSGGGYRGHERGGNDHRSRDRDRKGYSSTGGPRPSSHSESLPTSSRDNECGDTSPRKRTAEEMAAIAEKKRRLMAKYG